jgi:cysteine desulfurase
MVYLDNHATTPLDPRVLAAMMPYLTGKFGNAASRSHPFGWEAEQAVDESRQQIARLIGASPPEIIFTSGATESDNLAIKGVAEAYAGKGDHVIACAIEHKAVRDVCRRLVERGARVTWLPVGRDGLVDPGAVEAAIGERTVLVSIMYANNEVGAIQPVAEIGRICRERGVPFHSDAAQAVGKVPVDVEAMQIDLLSISAHKLYGPKGIGVLYVRRRPRARIAPLFDGGGQERALRSGTLPTPLCVGFGAAARLAQAEMSAEAERLLGLRRRFLAGITARLPQVRLNGDAERRVPGNLNLSFPGTAVLELMAACPGLAVSTGSACTAAVVEPSYVLRALGLPAALAASTLRIGIGRYTTDSEVDLAVDTLAAGVHRLVSGERVTVAAARPT